MLGENLSTFPGLSTLANEIDKYAVSFTKDAPDIGNLRKGKAGRYAQTGRYVFYFLWANPVTGLANSLHKFIQGRRKIYWSFKKTVELVPFIICCTLEILSVKYEE